MTSHDHIDVGDAGFITYVILNTIPPKEIPQEDFRDPRQWSQPQRYTGIREQKRPCESKWDKPTCPDIITKRRCHY